MNELIKKNVYDTEIKEIKMYILKLLIVKYKCFMWLLKNEN